MKMNVLAVLLLCVACAGGQTAVRSYEPSALASQLNAYREAAEANFQGENTVDPSEVLAARKEVGLDFRGSIAYCNNMTATNLSLDGIHKGGFVRAQCGWNLHLIFVQQSEEGWYLLNSMIVENKYEMATISVACVTGDNSEQVLVHGEQSASGTGMLEKRFVVFGLRENQVTSLLSEVESGSLSSLWVEHEISESSRFEFVPAKPDDGRDVPSFLETQIVRSSGRRIELKREHAWSKDRGQFVASQWYSVRFLGTGKKGARRR
jgi:hypothetical protein